jgi:hypothetical protein
MSVLAIAGPAAGSSRRSTAQVPQGFVGMVVDLPVWPDPYIDLAPQLDKMAASGVETVRTVFNWAQMQPYKSWKRVPARDRGKYVNVGGIPTNFSWSDQLVGLASQRGLAVAPVILGAPSWDGQEYKGGIVELPRSVGPYAAFAKALVRRYGPGGTFWSRFPYSISAITSWQIWNEPNIPAFWPPQPFAARYVALLRSAYAAIKSADPHATVILAGLPNYSWLDLGRIYKISGARNAFDAVAVHPYTKTPQGVITILGYVRKVMNQAGDTRKPILADEVSWPSSLGKTTHNVGYDFATTESGQAANIGKLLPMLVRQRRSLGLLGFDYYDWAGLERPNYLAFEFAGLFRIEEGAKFVAKPAFTAFKRAALGMEGCHAKAIATSCSG